MKTGGELNQSTSQDKKDAMTLATGLGKGFTSKEFGEYIEDYFKNPTEYEIDVDSEYYDAIEAAWGQIADEARIPVWQKVTVEASPIFKEYSKMKTGGGVSKWKEKEITIKDIKNAYSLIKNNQYDDGEGISINESKLEEAWYNLFQDTIHYNTYKKILKAYKENKKPEQILNMLNTKMKTGGSVKSVGSNNSYLIEIKGSNKTLKITNGDSYNIFGNSKPYKIIENVSEQDFNELINKIKFIKSRLVPIQSSVDYAQENGMFLSFNNNKIEVFSVDSIAPKKGIKLNIVFEQSKINQQTWKDILNIIKNTKGSHQEIKQEAKKPRLYKVLNEYVNGEISANQTFKKLDEILSYGGSFVIKNTIIDAPALKRMIDNTGESKIKELILNHLKDKTIEVRDSYNREMLAKGSTVEDNDAISYKTGGTVEDDYEKMVDKLEKEFEGKDLWDDEILDEYEVKQFETHDRDISIEIEKFINSKKKKFYVVPYDYNDDSYYYILVPKNKMSEGGLTKGFEYTIGGL